jgi:hypothetical protein
VVKENANALWFDLQGFHHRFGHVGYQFSLLFQGSSFKKVHVNDGHFPLLVLSRDEPNVEGLGKAIKPIIRESLLE